jgi:hypothetical protein
MIGVVLAQVTDGKGHIITYLSRCLIDAEMSIMTLIESRKTVSSGKINVAVSQTGWCNF